MASSSRRRRFSRAQVYRRYARARITRSSVSTAAGRALQEALSETIWAPPRWMSRKTYLGPQPATRQGPIGLRVRFAFRRPFIRPAIQLRTRWTTGKKWTPVRKSLEAMYGKGTPVQFEVEMPLDGTELKAKPSSCQARASRRAAVFAQGVAGTRGRQWKRMMQGAKRNAESQFHCGGV